MPCLAGASSRRRAQEPVLIETATGPGVGDWGQGGYLGGVGLYFRVEC